MPGGNLVPPAPCAGLSRQQCPGTPGGDGSSQAGGAPGQGLAVWRDMRSRRYRLDRTRRRHPWGTGDTGRGTAGRQTAREGAAGGDVLQRRPQVGGGGGAWQNRGGVKGKPQDPRKEGYPLSHPLLRPLPSTFPAGTGFLCLHPHRCPVSWVCPHLTDRSEAQLREDAGLGQDQRARGI